MSGLASLQAKKAQVRVLLRSITQRLMAVRAKVSSLVRRSTERLGIDSDVLEYFTLLRTVVSPEYSIAFYSKTLQAAPYSKPLHARLAELKDTLVATAAQNSQALQQQVAVVAQQRQQAADDLKAAEERAGVRGVASPTGHWRGKLLQYRSTREQATPLPSGVRLFNPDSPGSPEYLQAEAEAEAEEQARQPTSASSPQAMGLGQAINVRDRLAQYLKQNPGIDHDKGSPDSSVSAGSRDSGVRDALHASRAIRKQAASSRTLFQ
jgi:cell pole-organizing protein PopZ